MDLPLVTARTVDVVASHPHHAKCSSFVLLFVCSHPAGWVCVSLCSLCSAVCLWACNNFTSFIRPRSIGLHADRKALSAAPHSRRPDPRLPLLAWQRPCCECEIGDGDEMR